MSRYLLRTDGSLSVGSFSFDLALEQCGESRAPQGGTEIAYRLL